MSTLDDGGGSPVPQPPASARSTPHCAPDLVLPRGWRLSIHRIAGSVSVLLETAVGDTATVYVDLQTRERVADVPGGRAGSVMRGIVRHIVTGLEDSGGVETQPIDARFDGDDLSTWTPMQILALRTGARWELPKRFGGSTRQTRRVNDAIRSWSKQS